MPYSFTMDADFAAACVEKGRIKRTAGKDGKLRRFSNRHRLDAALSLLNPDNRLPATIVSSNMYANRSETIVLGKAIRDALNEGGRKAVIVVVSSLSNRMFTEPIDPSEDRIHSQKDDDWNMKILEFFQDGRLEDLSQLSREIHGQIRVQAYKPGCCLLWRSLRGGWRPPWGNTTITRGCWNGEVLAYDAHLCMHGPIRCGESDGLRTHAVPRGSSHCRSSSTWTTSRATMRSR